MPAGMAAICGAGCRERTYDRMNSRNGVRHPPWDTRVGAIGLAIPELREGSCFPGRLTRPRRRAEQALISVIAGSYLCGVSTRRVDKPAKALGIEGISRSRISRMAKALGGMVVALAHKHGYPQGTGRDAASLRNRPPDFWPLRLPLAGCAHPEGEGRRTSDRHLLCRSHRRLRRRPPRSAGLRLRHHRRRRGVDGIPARPPVPGAFRGAPGRLRRPGGPGRHRRLGPFRRCLAEVPRPFRPQLTLKGASGLPGPGGHSSAPYLRPAGGKLLASARRSGRAAGSPFPESRRDARGRESRHLGLRLISQGALAADLVRQPPGAPQPGDQAAPRRGGHLPQPAGYRSPGWSGAGRKDGEWQAARRYMSLETLAEARMKMIEDDIVDAEEEARGLAPEVV